MRYVLDSSVLAKLFIDEHDSEHAVELLKLSHKNEVELVASELTIYEVANTIWKRLRRSKDSGSEHIMQMFLLNIEYMPLNAEHAIDVMKHYHWKRAICCY